MGETEEPGFLRYLSRTDCLVVDGRVYSIRYGKETGSFIEFRKTRFGVFPGPLLQELERNWAAEHPEELAGIIDTELERKVSGIRQERQHSQEWSDPHARKKAIAYDVMHSVCMKDVLRPRKLGQDEDMAPSDDLFRIKEALVRRLQMYTTARRLAGQDALILGGAAYALKECSHMESESVMKNGLAFAKLGRRTFRTSGQLMEFIPRAAKTCSTALRQKARHEVETEDSLQDIIRKSRSRIAEEVMSLDEHFDNDNNTGFKKSDNGFFIYTKTPEYILWEHVNDRYYRFRPAEVGVRISYDSLGGLKVSFPLVLNRYKHPALSDIGQSHQFICFSNFDRSSVNGSRPVSTITMFLNHGCRMLMSNYCSDGNAFHDLESEAYESSFSDLEVPKDRVVMGRVTNIQACMRYKRSEELDDA